MLWNDNHITGFQKDVLIQVLALYDVAVIELHGVLAPIAANDGRFRWIRKLLKPAGQCQCLKDCDRFFNGNRSTFQNSTHNKNLITQDGLNGDRDIWRIQEFLEVFLDLLLQFLRADAGRRHVLDEWERD